MKLVFIPIILGLIGLLLAFRAVFNLKRILKERDFYLQAQRNNSDYENLLKVVRKLAKEKEANSSIDIKTQAKLDEMLKNELLKPRIFDQVKDTNAHLPSSLAVKAKKSKLSPACK